MSDDQNQDQSQEPQAEAPTQAPDGSFQITTVHQFAGLFHAWHRKTMQRLDHFQNVPDGIEFTVGDGASEKLTGDLRRGFLMGMSMAASEVANVPFVTTTEDESDSPAQEGTAANDQSKPN